MKASEIFLEYAQPLSESTPENISESELQKLLSVPELVWNATVLDRNPKRRKGDLPKHLKTNLKNQFESVSPAERKFYRELLKFWILRKDHLFAIFDWPIRVKVYKNIKGELIVRAEVCVAKNFTPNLPSEWIKEKTLAPVIPINQ